VLAAASGHRDGFWGKTIQSGTLTSLLSVTEKEQHWAEVYIEREGVKAHHHNFLCLKVA